MFKNLGFALVFKIHEDPRARSLTYTYNFLVYGGYKNYLGHSKTVTNNIYVYPNAITYDTFSVHYCQNSDGATLTDLPSGWDEVWSNNTCIISSSVIYYNNACDPTHLKGLVPFTANNHFYTANGTVMIPCGKNTTFTLEQYQKLGYDIGSTVDKLPSNSEVISWGKQLLGL